LGSRPTFRRSSGDLDLPAEFRDGSLSGVEVVDPSASTADSLAPALNLIGLTVEYYR
jgi:hypothetical protein